MFLTLPTSTSSGASTPVDIRLIILDRDGLINYHSSDPASPFYYILKSHHFIFKPGAKKALRILDSVSNTLDQQSWFDFCVATRQKCVSKDLLSSILLEDIHNKARREAGINYHKFYVESELDSKINLFRDIIYFYGCDPSSVLVIDDSQQNCDDAEALGMPAICTGDLLGTVVKLFNLA